MKALTRFAMRLVTICLVGVGICGCQSPVESPEAPRLVYHLDFNTHQMNRAAILRTLERVAADGYNAILWEIENKVEFRCAPELAGPDAFTREEFQDILAHADRLGLESIPLMQTLGHGEYVLGLDKYCALRENPAKKDCYCPSNPETVAFQKALLHEYLEIFGDRLKRFHLGGDEVYAFHTCPKCKARDKAELYVSHLEKVADELREKMIRPGIWHDMLQSFDKSGAEFARLPRDFTLWYWEYYYTGRKDVPSETKRTWAKGAEEAVLAERDKGREIILCASTQCYIDDPFMTRTWLHRGNVAGLAAVARRERLGYCVTSWMCHQGAKELQYPLYSLAAKRFLDPGFSVEGDWREIVRRDYGAAVPVALLDELTAWNDELRKADGRTWSPYKDGAMPACGEVLAKFKDNPDAAKELAGLARECRQRVDHAISDLQAIRRENMTPLAMRALAAGKLKSAYLKVMEQGVCGKPAEDAPIERTRQFYLREMTPHSAAHAAETLYNGYLKP